jgi:hypothetical protein
MPCVEIEVEGLEGNKKKTYGHFEGTTGFQVLLLVSEAFLFSFSILQSIYFAIFCYFVSNYFGFNKPYFALCFCYVLALFPCLLILYWAVREWRGGRGRALLIAFRQYQAHFLYMAQFLSWHVFVHSTCSVCPPIISDLFHNSCTMQFSLSFVIILGTLTP